MEDYLERFKIMVDELQAHPDVVVTHFWIGKPAHSLEIRKAESFLGRPLPSCLVDFYSSCNGLQLRWIHKDDESYDEDRLYTTSNSPFNMLFPPDDGQATGCVNILPISAVFTDSAAWEGIIYRHQTSNKDKVSFRGRNYPRLDFLQSVCPFDQYDSYFNMAFVFIALDDGPLPFVLGSNHHSSYEGDLYVDPCAYMEFLIRTKAMVNSRENFLGSAGRANVFNALDLADVPVLNLNEIEF